MNNFKKFLDDRLPDRREFYRSLKYKCYSKKDYLHAVNIWNTFENNRLLSCSLFKSRRSIISTDIFEKFIDVCFA